VPLREEGGMVLDRQDTPSCFSLDSIPTCVDIAFDYPSAGVVEGVLR
jgi:hypothetical protein